MEISEHFEIDASLADVWVLLRDPYVVAECFPGAELTRRLDDGAYEGVLRVRFGPTTATFAGKATIEVDDGEHSGRIEARGVDRRGSSAATARALVAVTEAGERCAVDVTGTIDMNGPLGGFAATGGAHVTELLLREFGQEVTARAAHGHTSGTDDR